MKFFPYLCFWYNKKTSCRKGGEFRWRCFYIFGRPCSPLPCLSHTSGGLTEKNKQGKRTVAAVLFEFLEAFLHIFYPYYTTYQKRVNLPLLSPLFYPSFHLPFCSALPVDQYATLALLDCRTNKFGLLG